MSLPRYREYRDSGLDWTPTIPSHWEVCALKRVATLKSGDSITSEQINETGEYAVYGGNGLRGFTSAYTHEGRFALVGRQGALCGNINYSQGKFWASEHAIVATPIKPTDTTWFGELLRAMNLNQYSASAAQPGLSVELISNIGVPYPPHSEQTAIATFLDHETAKIDALMAEQEKLIALLAEKRQATISHAVTRGLNPDAPMKDSGVAWLGEVPGHWEAKPLKKLARLVTGLTPSTDELDNYSDEGFPWVRPEDLDGSGNPTEASKFLSNKGWNVSRQVSAGAVMICCIGTIGKVGITQQVVSTNQQITSAEFVDDGRFFFYSISAARNELEISATGNVLRILNTERLGQIRLPRPPVAEQAAITAFLDSETARLDTLRAESERAITLLKERRAALIAAAVTGQIDVRGWVQPEREAEAA